MLKKTILLLLIVVTFFSFKSHKYYLSLTDIKYNEKSKSLQIITDVFIDDIESALNKKHNIDLQLTSKRELQNNDKYFEEYLKKNIIFRINGLNKSFTYIGKECKGDMVSLYYEIEDVLNISSVEIKNTLLIKTYSEQQNIIKFKINDKRKSLLLDINKDNGLLQF